MQSRDSPQQRVVPVRFAYGVAGARVLDALRPALDVVADGDTVECCHLSSPVEHHGLTAKRVRDGRVGRSASGEAGSLVVERHLGHRHPRYTTLKGRVGGEGGPFVLLQRVPAEERAVHLDIETDDLEAENRAAPGPGREDQGPRARSRRDDGAFGPCLLRGADPPAGLSSKAATWSE